MGNFLAYSAGQFSWPICALAILTTIFLQILSNLANDYGDTVHGADSADRQGPKRAVQAGLITSVEMKRMVIVFAMLSLISGISLLLCAFADQWITVMIFLGLGLLAIYAAVTYTAGSNPYGYVGLGDISVFLFFGLLGVCGSYFLQTQSFVWVGVFPAAACGLFATGVLNVNNIRDIESDQKAGKRSIPVRIGRHNAVLYHIFLLASGWVCALSFAVINFEHWTIFLFVLTLPLFVKNAFAVYKYQAAVDLDPFLKQLALSTLLFVVLFGFGQIF
jgi:1,4-dihydroxy-2-naphthoate octaprenyltransferase